MGSYQFDPVSFTSTLASGLSLPVDYVTVTGVSSTGNTLLVTFQVTFSAQLHTLSIQPALQQRLGLTGQVLSAASVAAATVSGIADAVNTPAKLLLSIYMNYSPSVISVALATVPTVGNSLAFNGTVYSNPASADLYRQLALLYNLQDAISSLAYNTSTAGSLFTLTLLAVEARFRYSDRLRSCDCSLWQGRAARGGGPGRHRRASAGTHRLDGPPGIDVGQPGSPGIPRARWLEGAVRPDGESRPARSAFGVGVSHPQVRRAFLGTTATRRRCTAPLDHAVGDSVCCN